MTAALAAASVSAGLAPAYDACLRLARAHYENFPVASWAVPARMRPHIAAVYAFARTADDFADEGPRDTAERHRLLDAWQARLDAVADGRAATWAAAPGEPMDAPLVFAALAHSIEACRLPASSFADLLSAFRQDTTVTRCGTWTEVLDYCRRSANPVGRLVLRIAGIDDPARDAESDAMCTALQLANFWQDFAEDWRRGRLYVPLDIAGARGARLDDLDRGVITPAWRGALAEVASRTWRLFEEGRPVCDAVRGRLRYELRLTWLGGTRILERVAEQQFDVFTARPSLGLADAPIIAARLLTWGRR